ncbi:MAG: EF-hand domain-containing protein [Candidatus Binatia bacterium]
MSAARTWVIAASCVVAGAAAAQTPKPTIELLPMHQERFGKADANRDGGLTRIEATAGGFEVSERFDAIDTDGDKVITLYEIGGYLATRTQEWATADRDGDGAISRSEASAAPSLAKIFTTADRDGDGTLRREEHEAWAQTSLYQNVDLPYVVPNIINKKF